MTNGIAEAIESEQEPVINDYAQQIDNIAKMIEFLEEELRKKEKIMEQVERELENTEQMLEDKAQDIIEKNKKLRDLEKMLKLKEEEMRFQEGELKVRSALDFLTFRTREEHLGKFESELESNEAKILDAEVKLRNIEEVLMQREQQLAVLQEEFLTGKQLNMDEMAGMVNQKLLDEKNALVSQKEGEIGNLSEQLEQMEMTMRQMEADMRDQIEAVQAGGGGGGMSKEDMARIRQSQYEIEEKGRELDGYKELLESNEQRLKDMEDELNRRELDIERKRKEMLSSSGVSSKDLAALEKSDAEVKYQIDLEVKKKLMKLEKQVKTKADDRVKPLLKKIEMLERRNDELEDGEGEIEQLRARLALKEDALKERLMEAQFSEEKIEKMEQRLIKERMKLEEDRKRVRASGGGGGVIDDDRLKEMEELIRAKDNELQRLEEKMRDREEFLRKKELEIKRLSDKMITDELEMEEAIESEKDVVRVSSGVRRLDDLMYGGLPFNSNIMVYGPSFTGKQVLLNLFVADALKKGIPIIYVLTDKTPQEVKEGLSVILPKIEVFEKKGLVKYIDAYSKSMGFEADDPNSIYINNPQDLDAITMAVTNAQKAFVGKHKYHKVAFHSISTIMAYSEPLVVFRFLQAFSSRCKRASAVSLLSMDAGMFKESEVSTIKHLMNGLIELKMDDLKTYLRIEGIGDVRTRAWVQYDHSSKNFLIKGSFAVDHIK